MTRRLLLTALASLVPALAPPPLAAHDGHDHTLLGVVARVSASRLEVTGRDGVVTTVALTAATVITRDGARLTATDLVAGDRVVVNVGNGKPPLRAKAVRVGVRETKR
jgi:hypothetical protein